MPWRPGGGAAAQAYQARTGIAAPKIIAWEITRSCNLACAHCRAAAHCHPYPGELSLDECKAVMDDIASITNPILILTGGEPLMRRDIWEIIDYAHALGMRPVIGTNGTLIDDEMAAKIAEHGIPRVSVSLDFPTAEGQDAFRGQAGAFESTVEGVRNLRAHGVEVQVNTTVTKMNNELMDDIHDLAERIDATEFHPFLLVPTGRGEDLVDVELSPEEYEEVLTWAYRKHNVSPMGFKPTDSPQYYRILRQQAARDGITISPRTHGREAMTRGCLGGISFVFISHVGDVQPCGYFDMQLGNVKETPFSQIWTESPVFNDLRDYSKLKGKCGACAYKGVCGGCRARALSLTGDYLAEEPYCAYVPPAWGKRKVIDLIQSGFPLERDPYGAIARQCGIRRDDVRSAIASLRREGTIRRVGASFASKKLGYTSTLCAIAVPDEQADAVAETINAFPQVTHNYLRNDRYNLWFTLITRDEAEKRAILDRIAQESGTDDILDMPATRTFKIRVDFGKRKKAGASDATENGTENAADTGSVDAVASVVAAPGSDAATTSAVRAFDAEDPFDVALVRWAQGDIVANEASQARAAEAEAKLAALYGEPESANRAALIDLALGEAACALLDQPFAEGAMRIGAELGRAVTEDQVLTRLRELKENGTIRRFGAMVAHRRMGYAFNGMTTWDIPEDQVEQAGTLFAGKPFVSHCYARPRSERWPFRLYAMTHAQSQEELDALVTELAETLRDAGIIVNASRCLISTKECKKVSMRYFE
jgi:heme b synthase